MKERDQTSTRTREWFCALSDRLDASFRASSGIQHNVTKGESRERQILDVLRQLLPTRTTLATNVVIMGSDDVESPKFDGVLFDRNAWPLLFAQDEVVVAMIESVVIALEIKSELTATELTDICAKASKLLSMKTRPRTPLDGRPLRVTAFAYECANPALMFYDFCVASSHAPEKMPASVCILNQAIFAVADPSIRPLSIVDVPAAGSAPVFLRTERDTLLVYLYFLSRWASSAEAAASLLRYADRRLRALGAFFFDSDFRHRLATDEAAREAGRKVFSGRPNVDVATLYREAREKVGLPPEKDAH